jgi:hypothetical protein
MRKWRRRGKCLGGKLRVKEDEFVVSEERGERNWKLGDYLGKGGGMVWWKGGELEGGMGRKII